jgi:hypothetical protein
MIPCALYAGLVLLLGYATLCAIVGGQRRRVAECLGLSLLLGLGDLGLLLFWASLAGAAPSRGLLLGLAGLGAVALAILAWRRRLVVPQRPEPLSRKDWLLVVPGAVLAYGVLVVGTMSLGFPLHEQDAFGDFALKAKLLASESLRGPAPFFHEPCLSYSHQDYPLMLPFQTAGLYGLMGEPDDQAGKLVCLMLYVGLALASYSFSRRDLSRAASGAVAAILMSLPAMLRWAGAGTGDAPLTVFYAGSVFYVARWIHEEKWQDLVLAVLFTAYAAFTKNEGLALAAIAAVVLGGFSLWPLRKRRLAGWGIFLGGAAVVLLPWMIWRAGLPHTDENYVQRLSVAGLLARAGELQIILPALAEQITAWHRWGPLWVLLLASAALGWRGFTRRSVVAVWLLAVLHVATYVAAYMVTPLGAAQLMPGTLDRLLLHVVPAAAILIGYHWSAVGAVPGSAPPSAAQDSPRAAVAAPGSRQR